MAQNREVGPTPLAAAHAATGLHTLLGVIAAIQVPARSTCRRMNSSRRTRSSSPAPAALSCSFHAACRVPRVVVQFHRVGHRRLGLDRAKQRVDHPHPVRVRIAESGRLLSVLTRGVLPVLQPQRGHRRGNLLHRRRSLAPPHLLTHPRRLSTPLTQRPAKPEPSSSEVESDGTTLNLLADEVTVGGHGGSTRACSMRRSNSHNSCFRCFTCAAVARTARSASAASMACVESTSRRRTRPSKVPLLAPPTARLQHTPAVPRQGSLLYAVLAARLSGFLRGLPGPILGTRILPETGLNWVQSARWPGVTTRESGRQRLSVLGWLAGEPAPRAAQALTSSTTSTRWPSGLCAGIPSWC
jgi:hypothetical protein